MSINTECCFVDREPYLGSIVFDGDDTIGEEGFNTIGMNGNGDSVYRQYDGFYDTIEPKYDDTIGEEGFNTIGMNGNGDSVYRQYDGFYQ